MIWGEGAIQAILLDSAGATVATLNLIPCSEREVEDYEDVRLTIGTDADSQTVEEFLGVRFHAVYLWLSHEDNQDDIATVQRLANWRGNGRQVRLIPHTDEPGHAVLCEVRSNPITPYGGKVQAEEIRIELYGVHTLAQKPNPAYDRVGRPRGLIIAA
ncbi:MAG: hypothetical protein PHI18_02015 [bacterium]|nr:hypothetical protein [bacterium]